MVRSARSKEDPTIEGRRLVTLWCEKVFSSWWLLGLIAAGYVPLASQNPYAPPPPPPPRKKLFLQSHLGHFLLMQLPHKAFELEHPKMNCHIFGNLMWSKSIFKSLDPVPEFSAPKNLKMHYPILVTLTRM